MSKGKKQKFEYKGKVNDDSIIIGSHGDASVKIDGTFDLSGIIYCPKYTVTLSIKGTGRVAFRGKCHRVIIKKMKGDCVLDLSELTCRELQCQSLRQNASVIAGKTRVVTQANLADEAVLQFDFKPLITNAYVADNARILHKTQALVSPTASSSEVTVDELDN